MWKARVFTLYPEMFPGPLEIGLYKKAREKKLWSLEVVNIRDYATDKHKTVDDTPFGGGSSTLIRADVVANSLDKNISNKNEPIIYLSPKGKKFDQIYAKKILNKNINIICGHFEGVDERLLETRNIEEISLGDYILSGKNVLSENVMTSTFTTTGSTSNTEVFYLTTTDSMLVEIELIDLTIETAKGYFGQVNIPFESEVTLIDTIAIPNPVLDLEGASAKLTIDNYIGAELRLKFDEISMDDQLLEHPSLFGVHDIARAYWIDETLINHTSLELDLGETGSNIFDLIETFPRDLAMSGSVQLNPFGDVSLGHDYINNSYPPKLELELDIPLKLGLDGVVLEEEYSIDPMNFPKFDGRLLVDLTSTFPVEVLADIDYVVNDEDGTIVSISGNIDAGSAYPEVSQHGLLVIPLNEETVSPGGSVYVRLTASTDGAVTFTGYENVRVQIRIEGTQLLEVD